MVQYIFINEYEYININDVSYREGCLSIIGNACGRGANGADLTATGGMHGDPGAAGGGHWCVVARSLMPRDFMRLSVSDCVLC